MSNSYQEITDVVQVYFDGLYECDTEKLATIFHPSAHCVREPWTASSWTGRARSGSRS